MKWGRLPLQVSLTSRWPWVQAGTWSCTWWWEHLFNYRSVAFLKRVDSSCYAAVHRRLFLGWSVMKRESWHRQTRKRIKVKPSPEDEICRPGFSQYHTAVFVLLELLPLSEVTLPRRSPTARSHISNQRAASYLYYLSECVQSHLQSNCVLTFGPSTRLVLYSWFCPFFFTWVTWNFIYIQIFFQTHEAPDSFMVYSR